MIIAGMGAGQHDHRRDQHAALAHHE
jgi:hypothetical protein